MKFNGRLQFVAACSLTLLLVSLQLEWGRRASHLVLVDVIPGKFSPVEVLDHRTLNVRFLRYNGTILGGMHLTTGESAFRAFVIMSAILYTRVEGTRALSVGLGAASLNRILQRQGIVVDSVEIEPAVVQAARQYFRWKPNGFVAVEDAYNFLERHDANKFSALYDYVVLDVFTASKREISRLYTSNSIERFRSLMKPGAIMVLNLVTFVEQIAPGQYTRTSSVFFSTLKRSFEHVRCFIDDDASTSINDAVNLICFASDSEINFHIPQLAQSEYDTSDDIIHRFQSWEIRFSETSRETFADELKTRIDAEDGIVHANIAKQIHKSIA